MAEPFSFEGQRKHEEVLIVWRQHPWVLAKPGLISVGVLLLVAVILKFFGASGPTSLAIVAGLAIVAAIAFNALFRWSNSLYILTTERIIDVDQRHVLHRVVGELPIENIQDATYEVKGLLATVLNFGDVVVQTVGGATTITMKNVEAPYRIQQEVLEARNAYVKPTREA